MGSIVPVDMNANMIMRGIQNGEYSGPIVLLSYVQIHIPYIKKENIVEIYPNFNKAESDAKKRILIF